jgi:hypothetical protein
MAAPAKAGFVLMIDDPAFGAGAEATVSDNGPGDSSAAAGIISFTGFAISPSWLLTLAVGTTGTPAMLTLNANSTSTAAGTLNISLTNTDFTGALGGSTPFDMTVGHARPAGAGSLSADLFVDDGNAEFGTGANPISVASTSNVFTTSEEGVVAGLSDPFSMTIQFILTHASAASSVTSASARIAPIPGAIWLFGSALLGLLLTGRFGRRSNVPA